MLRSRLIGPGVCALLLLALICGCGGNGGDVDVTGSIAGTVRIQDGGPAASAMVVAEAASMSKSTTANGDGTFEIAGLEPGRYTVVAEMGRELSTVKRGVTVETRAVTTVDLQLVPTGWVVGNVTREDAVDHSGIRVALLGTGHSATTDANGDYTITHVPASATPYQLIAQMDGYLICDPQEVTVNAGEATEAASIVLKPLVPGAATLIAQSMVMDGIYGGLMNDEQSFARLDSLRQQYPDSGPVNFAWAVGRIVVGTKALAVKYGLVLDRPDVWDESWYRGEFGGTGLPSAATAAIGLTFRHLPRIFSSGDWAEDSLNAPLSLAQLGNVMRRGSPTRATEADFWPLTVAGVQQDIKDILIPALEDALPALRVAQQCTDPIMSLLIETPDYWSDAHSEWHEGEVRVYNIYDAEMYALEAVIDGLLAQLRVLVAYNLDPGDYDFDLEDYERDADSNGILTPAEWMPASPFGELVDASEMAAAKSDTIAGLNAARQAISIVLNETRANGFLEAFTDEDRPGTTPEEARADLEELDQDLAEVQAAIDAPSVVTMSLTNDEGEQQEYSITCHFGAFYDTPPADLKALMPNLGLESSWGEAEGYTIGASWPDRTLGGIFPNGDTEFPENFWGDPAPSVITVTIN